MLKSEVQHHFWVTKKVVERKLGTKEDECIVSSDAELDAKIELFKTISESCNRLHRIIDQYQERLCILAQEENALGKFLKETGKNSNTSGKVMICAGKAISYCGQQRMIIRPPLLRLFHEVDTFRGRAIVDTHNTIMNMEKERTEYRAALSWMKSASNQLDPDTGRGVEKFRKAQTHVRLSKAKFDRLSLDCLQKIDLLAAARCNMFSHALVSYMAALLQFAMKSSETFKATAEALSTNTQYNFCVLKDLTDSGQQQEIQNDLNQASNTINPIDADQMLFFLDDYTDEKKTTLPAQKTNQTKPDCSDDVLIEISSSSENQELVSKTADLLDNLLDSTASSSTLKEEDKQMTNELTDEYHSSLFIPSQLLLDEFSTSEDQIGGNLMASSNPIEVGKPVKSKNSILEFFNRPTNPAAKNSSNSKDEIQKPPKQLDNKKDMSSWFNLFAELDPLANPDAIAKKIEGNEGNSQDA